MFSQTLLVFLVVSLVSDYSYAQRHRRLFRSDYYFIQEEEVRGFYKIHTFQKTWSEAKKWCELEGATLFYPENKNEANAVISYWNKTQPFQYVFVGISDLVSKGVFKTLDGLPLFGMYNNWAPGEPDNEGSVEDCVVLTKDGLLNNTSCFRKFPFICKRSFQTVDWNKECQMSNLEYIYNKGLGHCYKFHTTPLNWADAYAVCSAEESYLIVINSQQEADFVANIIKITPKERITGNYFRGSVHAGFHNRGKEGWRTINGTLLEDTGYSRWLWGNDQLGGEREECGSVFYNGFLNDIHCDKKSLFICEHEIDQLEDVTSFRIISPEN